MLEAIRPYKRLLEQMKPDGKKFTVLQVDHKCNRDCSYCGQGHNDQTTLEQTFKQIDKIDKLGFAIMSYIGGEPFMPDLTPEGIPIY